MHASSVFDVDCDSRSTIWHAAFTAINKVVHQWESRKRVPSPVFWKRVET